MTGQPLITYEDMLKHSLNLLSLTDWTMLETLDPILGHRPQ